MKRVLLMAISAIIVLLPNGYGSQIESLIYRDTVKVSTPLLRATNLWIERAIGISRYSPRELCDYPFFELDAVESLSKFTPYGDDTTIFSPYLQARLFDYVNIVKLRRDSIWECSESLVEMDLAGNYHIEPMLGERYLETHIFAPDSSDWIQCSYTVIVEDSMGCYRYHIECELAQQRVVMQRPYNPISCDRAAFVSHLLLVRNFTIHTTRHRRRRAYKSKSKLVVSYCNGIYLLGRVYKFHDITFLPL